MSHLKTTWYHARRSPYQAFAAIFIMMQTFFVATVFSFLVVGSAKIISYFESLPQVTVFFKNEAKQEAIDVLKRDVESTGKVAKTRFVSKQEALKIYQEKFRDDPLLLEFVTSDILPSSLEISTNKIEDLTTVSNMLSGSQIIHEVVFPKDVISNLTAWTSALRKIGLALIIMLVLDSIFLMIIIIGIKISQKKDEIEIMRLIGATSWYIRWPFIFEGMFYGAIGALIGWTIASLTLLYAVPFLKEFLRGIPLFPVSPLFLFEVLGIELLLALILGCFSSFLAVLRYLK